MLPSSLIRKQSLSFLQRQALPVFLLPFLLSFSAQAEPTKYHNPVYATNIQMHMGQTQIAGTHNFETEILTSNGDTMFYVRVGVLR